MEKESENPSDHAHAYLDYIYAHVLRLCIHIFIGRNP